MIVIANKIDLNEQAVKRKYVFVEEIECPLEFVSAADGTNVVSIFQTALGGVRLGDTVLHQKDGSYTFLNRMPLDTV